MVKKKKTKKKRSLLHFPHLLPSHAFSAPSQQCACSPFDVEVGVGGGGERGEGRQSWGHKVTIEKQEQGAKEEGWRGWVVVEWPTESSAT